MKQPPAQRRIADLEAAFRQILRERMNDVPILNRALTVEAVGFREWGGHQIGVLVTPWFMNLMLLPGDGGDWDDEPVGTTRSYAFPSGSYDFLVGREPGIGSYAACSLFSPVFEFETHDVAVSVAGSIMEELFCGGDEHARSGLPEALGTDQGLQKPMTRRDVLRGAFLRDRQE